MRGYRVGIVNPRGAFGRRVHQLLEERGLPTIEVKLFESEHAQGSALTRFRDEIVVTQPLDPEVFPRLDLMFLSGEESDLLNRAALAAAREGILTFVTATRDLDAPLIAETPAEEPTWEEAALRIVPRTASHLVGVTLSRLAETFTIERASVNVLLPAAEWGQSATEELHQQVVHILNFKDPPKEIFKDQIAFNLLPAGTPQNGARLADAVREETALICGVPRLSLSLIQVPVFHGYAASLWVELDKPVQPAEIVKCFRASSRFEVPVGGKRLRDLPSPVSVAESEKIHLGPVRPQGDGTGFWIWLAADSLAYDPANAAIQAAKAALLPKGSD